MKSQLIHQKSNFDFLVNIEIQKPRVIKIFKTIKLDHQESRKSTKVKTQDFQTLSKNSSVLYLKTLTSQASFIKIQADSRKTFNVKVVGINELYNFVNVG